MAWIHGYPFAETMRRVLPDVQFLNMDVSDPVFHSFFGDSLRYAGVAK